MVLPQLTRVNTKCQELHHSVPLHSHHEVGSRNTSLAILRVLDMFPIIISKRSNLGIPESATISANET